MGKKISDVKFELGLVYKTYADQLLLASNISNFLLKNTNIDSAGEQVEGSLRILLNNLLPERVKVTHGHIVDKKAIISNQQDILIAESSYTRSLIRSLDGTEFYPYEAVFACGEVKRSFSAQKFSEIISNIAWIKKKLNRNNVPPDHILSGSNLLKHSGRMTNNSCRNPFFYFIFSIDYSKDYTQSKVEELLKKTEKTNLPNTIVILKRGIYVYINKEKISKGKVDIKLYPEYIQETEKCDWVFIRMSPEKTFAYLIFMLTQHINDTVLEKPSTMEYGQSLINIPITSIYFIK